MWRFKNYLRWFATVDVPLKHLCQKVSSGFFVCFEELIELRILDNGSFTCPCYHYRYAGKKEQFGTMEFKMTKEINFQLLLKQKYLSTAKVRRK